MKWAVSFTRHASSHRQLSWLQKWQRRRGSLVPSNGQEAQIIPLLQEAPATNPNTAPAHEPAWACQANPCSLQRTEGEKPLTTLTEFNNNF